MFRELGCQSGDGGQEDTVAELLGGVGWGRVRVRSVQSLIGGRLQEINVTWDKGPLFLPPSLQQPAYPLSLFPQTLPFLLLPWIFSI